MKKKESFYVVDSKNLGELITKLTEAIKINKKVYKNGVVRGLKDLEVVIYKPGQPLLKKRKCQKN